MGTPEQAIELDYLTAHYPIGATRDNGTSGLVGTASLY